MNGTLSGGFSLSKTGSNTLILTGTNIYTGGTTISNGVLFVANTNNATSATGTGSVTIVKSTGQPGFGTLTGSGYVSGTVVDNGGNISATNLGGGTAALTTGALTLGTGSAYICAISASSADELSVNGTMVIGTGVNLDVISLTAANLQGTLPAGVSGAGYSWPIATASGGITGAANLTLNTSGFSAAGGLGGGQFNVTVVGNTLYLNFGAPPVAGAFAIGAVEGIPAAISAAKILSVDQSQDSNGALTIASVTSPTTNGATNHAGGRPAHLHLRGQSEPGHDSVRFDRWLRVSDGKHICDSRP